MIAYTAKVLHQPIKFVESWPAVSLCAFSNKSEFLKDSDGVVEFLPGERISPCRPGNREDVGEMGKIIAAGLRLDILSELFCERHQGWLVMSLHLSSPRSLVLIVLRTWAFVPRTTFLDSTM